MPPRRILLSVPHMGGNELRYVREAFKSNWLSTVGPHVVAFEQEIEARLGIPAAALCSGTAAIHLGLRLLGVAPGDEVACQALTFVATASPILYLGARPVFLDSERATWNLDPDLLERFLAERASCNRLPRAVVVVHLFGQCAQMDAILWICGRYGVPVFEDAAEALGATYRGRPAGTLGAAAAFSFNGNKIITTAGGGALVSPKREWIEKARFWAGHAREPRLEYQHVELGQNYRLSNVLAGIGRGQLRMLDVRVAQRRANAFRYAAALAPIDGLELMPQASNGTHTNWLTCFLVDRKRCGCSRDELIRHLDHAGVETRPLWKPLQLQPLFAGCEFRGSGVSEDIFHRGICLPSSSSLTLDEQLYVANQIRAIAGLPALSSFPGENTTVAGVGTPDVAVLRVAAAH